MEIIFFNISSAFIILLLIIAACYRKVNPAAVITGALSVGYSIIFDIIFGDRLGLYYYISPSQSTLYMVLGAVLTYSTSNILYLAFLPGEGGKVILYTAAWIAVMLAFEYASTLTRTIVFTGWTMFPWSVLTYILTYLLLNTVYRYLAQTRKFTGVART